MMTILTEGDRQEMISTITLEERATVEAIMGLLNGYSFNQAKKILKASELILATALVDSTKCAQFFEE